MAEPSAPLLSVALRHRLGEHTLTADFRTQAPWTLLFGPSGSGKSTLLRAIAGFVTPDEGHIRFAGRDLLDTARGHNLAPHLRPVRSAPQTPRLLPHRRVLANLRYGVDPATPVPAQQPLLDAVIALFRLDPVTDRLPHQLSGGERQRVSVARAVLSAATATVSPAQPALLLLDEPFSGLDTALRDDLAPELRDWLAERRVPVLSVSHDVAEACLLGAEVLRIADGRITGQGPAGAVLAAERQRLLRHLDP